MDLGFTTFDASGAGDSEAALQPLDWSGLCARLAAERDLRRALCGDGARAGAGSFAPGAAAALNGTRRGAPSVNPEPLANGKAPGAMAGAAGDNRRADLGGHE